MASMAITLFYYEILRLFLEGYLELVTACWMNFYAPDKSSANFAFGVVFSVAVLSVCFLALPAAAIVALLPQFRDRLTEGPLQRRIGALYSEQKTTSAWSLAYNAVFIGRRFAFLMFFLLFDGPATVQILVVLYLNLTSLVYVASTRALGRRLHNQLDCFDEYWICILSFHLVCFSDLVGDAAVAVGYGWLMIGLMLVNMLVKVCFILWENWARLRMVYLTFILPFWLNVLKPRLLQLWEMIRDQLVKLGCLKPRGPTKEALAALAKIEEAKAEEEDPAELRGFSSGYLIVQQLNQARGKLSNSRRARKKLEE